MTKPAIDIQRLADAIWHAEGGRNTRYPYGIMIPARRGAPSKYQVFDRIKAREICIRTINTAYKKYTPLLPANAADFIAYLGRTYCPGSDNSTWVKNVRWFYTFPKRITS